MQSYARWRYGMRLVWHTVCSKLKVFCSSATLRCCSRGFIIGKIRPFHFDLRTVVMLIGLKRLQVFLYQTNFFFCQLTQNMTKHFIVDSTCWTCVEYIASNRFDPLDLTETTSTDYWCRFAEKSIIKDLLMYINLYPNSTQ